MTPTLLIVEDDSLQSELLEIFATSVGYKAMTAMNAQEALSQFDANEPDIVLLDYQLPDMLGKDLVSTLRTRIRNRWLPIIFLSAHDEISIQQECLQAGGDDFITKPVDLIILEAKLKAMSRVAVMQKTIVEQNHELNWYIARQHEESTAARYLYERLTRVDVTPPSLFQQRLLPAESFSGDLILCNQGSNGHYYAVIADATGHGLSAAIGLIPMTQVFRAMSQKGHSVSAIVSEMHKQLKAYTPSYRFIAAIVLEIDPVNHSVSVWNGGMPDATLFHPQEGVRHYFRSRHLPLGVEANHGFDADVEHYAYTPGEEVFCCSDGLLEASNPEGHPVPREDIENLLLNTPAEHILQSMLSLLKQHMRKENPPDDVAVLLAKLPDPQTLSQENQASKITTIPECRWSMTFSGAMLQQFDPVPLAVEWLARANLGSSALSRAHTILMELVTNAIDHGLLSLPSSLKEQPDGFVRYLQERQKRLSELQSGEIELILDVFKGPTACLLIVDVRDSGEGYQDTGSSDFSPLQKSGRGLRLVRSLSRSVTTVSPGNRVRVEMDV